MLLLLVYITFKCIKISKQTYSDILHVSQNNINMINKIVYTFKIVMHEFSNKESQT